MNKGPRKPDAADPREARLKAALRANLAKRKAQGRARAEESHDDDEQQGPKTPQGRVAGNEE